MVKPKSGKMDGSTVTPAIYFVAVPKGKSNRCKMTLVAQKKREHIPSRGENWMGLNFVTHHKDIKQHENEMANKTYLKILVHPGDQRLFLLTI